MKRGIIASPAIVVPTNDYFDVTRVISSEELRFLVLYWDEVLIPYTNCFHMGFPEEVDFLNCGAIKRPVVYMPENSAAGMALDIMKCQGLLAKELVKDKEFDWVLHQLGDETYLLNDFSIDKQVLRFEMVNQLPSPQSDVPINEILEFKERRMDEIIALHDSLDELYLDTLSQPDLNLASKKSIKNLQTSIDSLNKTTKERFKNTKKFDLSTELNLDYKSLVSGSVLGAIYEHLTPGGDDLILAATLGVLASSIKLSAKMTSTFNPAKDNLKLSYLTRASKEGIL